MFASPRGGLDRPRSDAPGAPGAPGGRWKIVAWVAWFAATGAMEAADAATGPSMLHGAGGVGRGLALGVLYGALNSLQLLAAIRTTVRHPVVGRRIGRSLRLHLVMALATGVAFAVGDALASRFLVHGTMPGPERVLQHAPGYLLLTVVVHAVVYARRARRTAAADRRLRERLERLGSHRAEAELRALKAELHPLLLEDALDVATGLVLTEPSRAQRVLAELGVMMRDAVSRSTVREVTLDEELEALEPLVHVASAAHVPERDAPDERPWLLVEIPDDLREALVPHLVLHPVVAHASRRARDHEALTLRVRRVGDAGGQLELAVLVVPAPRWTATHASATTAPWEWEARSDPAPSPATSQATAQALAALRRRLTALHGEAATLSVGGPRESVAAMVTLPFRAAAGTPDGVPPAGVPPATMGAAIDGAALEGWAVSIAHHDATPAASPVAVVGSTLLLLEVADALAAIAGTASPRAAAAFDVSARSMRGVAMLWLAVRVARLHPFAGSSDVLATARRHARVTLVVATVATVAHVAALTAAHAMGVAMAGPGAPFFFTALVAMYVVLAGVVHAITATRGRRRSAQVVRELRLALTTAAHQRTRAELRALKAELNPHFVGNALHTATSLARHDAAAAAQMLRALASLAREAAAQTMTEEVTLTQELACLQPFLAIERARLGLAAGALSVDWEVAPDVLDAWVPHSVLQPLVENAVRHGLAPRGGAGRLTVRARRTSHPRRPFADVTPAGWLELAVIDDGVGLTAPSASRSGTGGLGTGGLGVGAGSRGIEGRLAALYGPRALFELVPGSEQGAVARLVIPLRVAPATT